MAGLHTVALGHKEQSAIFCSSSQLNLKIELISLNASAIPIQGIINVLQQCDRFD